MANQKRSLLQKGERFERFLVLRLLGRGGVGEVYKIRWEGQIFALKVIPIEGANEDEMRANIEKHSREGQLLTWLKHPNVINVYEVGVTDHGLLWMRMEYLRGRTLREELHRPGGIPLAEALRILRSVSLGAHQCHTCRSIHRDIKPENVMIGPGPRVTLLDFGMVKLMGGATTREGHRQGTPAYMAPEQVSAGKATPAIDVHAIGVVAFEMLTGRHPFVADLAAYEMLQVFHKIFNDRPAFTEQDAVPAPIQAWVMKALEKDPRKRFPDGISLATAIGESWESVGKTIAVAEPPKVEPPRERRPRSGVVRLGTAPMPRTSDVNVVHAAAATTAPLPAAYDVYSPPPSGFPGWGLTAKMPDASRDPACVRVLSQREPRGEPRLAAGDENDTLRVPSFAPEKPDRATSETRLRSYEPDRAEPAEVKAPSEAAAVAEIRARLSSRVVRAATYALVFALGMLVRGWLPSRGSTVPEPASASVPVSVSASVSAPVSAPVSVPASVSVPVPVSVSVRVSAPVPVPPAARASITPNARREPPPSNPPPKRVAPLELVE